MIVNWTDAATRDLRSAHRNISRDNPTAAIQVVSVLFVVGDRLGTFPRRGRAGRVPDTCELVVPRMPYTIVHRIKDEQVEVIRVLQHAELWPDML